jgi:hypothetical protein
MRSEVVAPGHEPPAVVNDGRRRAKALCTPSLEKAYGELEAIRERPATGMEGLPRKAS